MLWSALMKNFLEEIATMMNIIDRLRNIFIFCHGSTSKQHLNAKKRYFFYPLALCERP